MQVENKIVYFAPGRAVTVEIKIDQRRMIEFVMSPRLDIGQEIVLSCREGLSVLPIGMVQGM